MKLCLRVHKIADFGGEIEIFWVMHSKLFQRMEVKSRLHRLIYEKVRSISASTHNYLCPDICQRQTQEKQ